MGKLGSDYIQGQIQNKIKCGWIGVSALRGLRAEAEEFGAEAGVVLGLAEVRHFVGGGFGADDFDKLMFFGGRPAG